MKIYRKKNTKKHKETYQKENTEIEIALYGGLWRQILH